MALQERRTVPSTEMVEFDGVMLTVQRFPDTSVIPHEERERIADELTPLTGEGFMRFDLGDSELHQDVANHVVEAPRLTIARNEMGKPVAFIASDVFDIEGVSFYHLGGIIVSPSVQGKGLGFSLLAHDLIDSQAQGIVFRTQNKNMYKLGEKVAELSEELAIAIAPQIYPKNLDGNVNRGAYRDGHSLYDDVERFAQIAIDTIDWRNGDSLVVAGKIKPNLSDFVNGSHK